MIEDLSLQATYMERDKKNSEPLEKEQKGKTEEGKECTQIEKEREQETKEEKPIQKEMDPPSSPAPQPNRRKQANPTRRVPDVEDSRVVEIIE
jgi:hypothetical protein